MLDALACRHPFLLTRVGIVSYNLRGVVGGLDERNWECRGNRIKFIEYSLKN